MSCEVRQTVKRRPVVPAGHGELLEQPSYSEWREALEANLTAISGWSFQVAGVGAKALRESAREELLAQASTFSARLGVPVRPHSAAEMRAPLIVTGHQPDLYHPGIWVKNFLLQRFAREQSADSLDLVVDSDGFDHVAVTSPCLVPEPRRCVHYLAVGGAGSCYATAPVPSHEHVEAFCSAVLGSLAGLSSPAPARHFTEFCSHLHTALPDATDLAEVVTFARRRYEATSGTDYPELPVTTMARSASFARFIVHVAGNAATFAAAYNAELEVYRNLTRTRSKVQPFPDLEIDAGSVELPFWRIADGVRAPVRAVIGEDGGVTLATASGAFLAIPADPESAIVTLAESGEILAPKALALTMFVRLFVADLFIHGVGGGRYDRITDGVIRRFFGVEPPSYVVASLTVYLPLGAHIVEENELSVLRERINRLEHNPDAALGEADFASARERDEAMALADEKARLVTEISRPDADRKTLGLRIRGVNDELAQVVSPLREALEDDLRRLEGMHQAAEILTDRSYPFCFWNPCDVADKAW